MYIAMKELSGNRFNVRSARHDVSFKEYKETALALKNSILGINSNFSSEVHAIPDDHCYSILSGMTPEREIETMLKQRPKYPLVFLDESLWDQSFYMGLYIRNNKTDGIISLVVDKGKADVMQFYGNNLDQVILDRFLEFR